MSDALLIFENAAGENRTGTALASDADRIDRTKTERHFAWGRLILYGRRKQAAGDDGPCCVVLGEAHCPTGAAEDALREASRSGRLSECASDLSGMFVAITADDASVHVVTDRLGFRPVYVGARADGGIGAIGTHPDDVAGAVGAAARCSDLSLAELLLFGNVTYPYTLHERVTELAPGSVHTVSVDHTAATLESTAYWTPKEPARFASFSSCLAGTIDAVRAAGRAVSDNRETLAVMLSGGRDSRAALGAIGRREGITCVTFADRENRETRVAANIASAAGVPHRILRRSETFYEQMPLRTAALIGGEVSTFGAHGWVVSEQDAVDDYEAFTGGFFGDALLRGDGAPYRRRLLLLKHYLGERVGGDVRTLSEPWRSIAPRRGALRPDLVEAALQRLETRINDLRAIRPRSAVEWASFYPASRNCWMSFAFANARLFRTDEVFTHKEVLAASAEAPIWFKASGRLFNKMAKVICPDLWRLPVAHDGLPASAGWLRRRMARSKRASYRSAVPANSKTPWRETEHSWQDPASMQRLSPAWQVMRDAACQCIDGVAALDAVTERPAIELLRSYDESVDALFNYAAVQIALHTQAMQDGWASVASRCATPAAPESADLVRSG